MTGHPMNRTSVAVYDFDNTVYNGNSIVDFWKYAITRYPYILLWAPYQMSTAILWKCRIMQTASFKEAFLSFIRAIPSRSFDSCINSFWDRYRRKIPGWVSEQIIDDRGRGLYPVCISASPDFLLEGITEDLGFETLLCSEFKKHGPVQTNKMKVPNCKGHEKIRRLKEWARREGIRVVVQKVYSDSTTDLPLYQTAKEHYHVTRGVLRAGMPTP